MASSLSKFVDNLTERIYKIKCKDCDCFLEYENVKDNLMKYNFLSCNKDHSNITDEELKKMFKNTLKFSNNGINRFILLFIFMSMPYLYDHIFIHMINGESLIKHHLKRRDL